MRVATTAAATRHEDFPSSLRLDENRVDVWHCCPDSLTRGQISSYLSTLSRDELARYRRMRSAERRRHFVVGRAIIRDALSRYVKVDARSLRLVNNEHGRPAVAWPPAARNINFSLSHTSGLIAMAVSPVSEIGIDVENVDRPVEIPEVSDLVFTSSEQTLISGSALGARKIFFELWTLKEAYLKARGKGFSLSPRTFQFANDNGQISLECHSECDPSPGRWQFNTSKHGKLQLAIAVGSRSVTQIQRREWKPTRPAGSMGLI